MSLDSSLVSLVVRYPDTFATLAQAGVTAEDFEDDWAKVWRYICRTRRDHGHVPSADVLSNRYDFVDVGGVRRRDMGLLLADIRKRRTHRSYVEALLEAVDSAEDFDNVADSMARLQGRLNALHTTNGSDHLRDLFSRDVTRQVVTEIRARRSGSSFGFPTGLTKLDAHIGGMQRQRMIVVMGRPGLGKSWLDLLFVANAVMNGSKVGLYPLEMTLYETAFRLYTIFTAKMFGQAKVLRNYELIQGRITPRKVVRLLHALEDRFAGQLYVADVGSLADPYTPERVEADTEVHHFDITWVDYITLMQAPRLTKEDNEVALISRLSKGLKGAAQRRNCVAGTSAQINRDALRVKAFIPRLEHIYGGDAIGHDADQVVSINRQGRYLYYGLVKNRHGPEFGRTRVRFDVNIGNIHEEPGDDDGED